MFLQSDHSAASPKYSSGSATTIPSLGYGRSTLRGLSASRLTCLKHIPRQPPGRSLVFLLFFLFSCPLPLGNCQLDFCIYGTWPATQACALSGNRTGDPLVCKPALSPLSHTSQGGLCISVVVVVTSLSFLILFIWPFSFFLEEFG